ncbi:MAG: hypothetical protein ABJB39_06170 [Chloroflexota bacterium]
MRPATRRLVAFWVIVPAFLGAVFACAIDPRALPFTGHEQLSAVFLLDGQAYFGHLEDVPWSGTITLRDVYYFEDASKVTTDLPLALVKRGGELHQPVDVMRIRRDKVLVVERVSLDSAVGHAIASQRAVDRAAK